MLQASQYPDKVALRKALRLTRARIAAGDRRIASRQLVRLALRHRLLARHRRIGFYMPAKNEIDVRPLLEQARTMGVECYLPIVPGRRRKKLWFIRLGIHNAWVLNRYGIPEYRHAPARRLRAYQLDLLFLPLLGFDLAGWRIGMGGGYYDASLAKLRHRRHWQPPALVGVAYRAQQVDSIPRDPWDVRLRAILTEDSYLLTSQK